MFLVAHHIAVVMNIIVWIVVFIFQIVVATVVLGLMDGLQKEERIIG